MALFASALALLPGVAQAQTIEAWVQRYHGLRNGYDGAAGIAATPEGNIYVAGTSSDSSGFRKDYVTLSYSSAGVPLWTNRYDELGNSHDQAVGLVADADGNIHVTGFSLGGSGSDYFTLKYSSAGLLLWSSRYDSGGDDYPAGGMAVDARGNVFVTGTANNGSNQDYMTVKLSEAGVLLWARRYNGPGNGDDSPNDVAVDAGGNVFVSGTSDGGSTGEDWVTIAYSSAGAPLWTNFYHGTGNDRAKALTVDTAGNVVVTGGSAGVADYVTIQYSGTGVPLWTNLYSVPEAGGDGPQAVAMDASGSVYVTGSSGGGNGYGDYATLKYSSAGVPSWTNRYNGPANAGDYAKALALDPQDNVVVTGFSVGSGTGDNYLTIAYSSAGMPLWTNRYLGPLRNASDEARAVVVNGSGAVYVTGKSRDSDFYDNITTVKYVVPPILTRQPLSGTNAVGTTASFTVEVAGSGPFTYQWLRGELNLVDGGFTSGATTTNLQIREVQLTDADDYTVVVNNPYGTATSAAAHLTVVVRPSGGRLTNLSYSPATGFSFIFREGTVGQTYRIQRSLSLAEGSWVDWESLTYTGAKGFMDLSAVEATNRFYRAVSP